MLRLCAMSAGCQSRLAALRSAGQDPKEDTGKSTGATQDKNVFLLLTLTVVVIRGMTILFVTKPV
jgi:hypothetical protein